MSIREKREALRLTIKQMAKRCECSEILLKKIEDDGWVTHPHVASRIAANYGMSLEEYNTIVPEFRRAKVLPAPTKAPGWKEWQRYTQRRKRGNDFE